MAIFYAFANTNKGKAVLLTNDTWTDRLTANSEARAYCKREDMVLGDVQIAKGSKNTSSTMTKYAKIRKRKGTQFR